MYESIKDTLLSFPPPLDHENYRTEELEECRKENAPCPHLDPTMYFLLYLVTTRLAILLCLYHSILFTDAFPSKLKTSAGVSLTRLQHLFAGIFYFGVFFR